MVSLKLIEVNGSQPLHNEKMSSNHSVRGDNERSGVIATSEYETNDTYSNQSNSTGQILYCAPSKHRNLIDFMLRNSK